MPLHALCLTPKGGVAPLQIEDLHGHAKCCTCVKICTPRVHIKHRQLLCLVVAPLQIEDEPHTYCFTLCVPRRGNYGASHCAPAGQSVCVRALLIYFALALPIEDWHQVRAREGVRKGATPPLWFSVRKLTRANL